MEKLKKNKKPAASEQPSPAEKSASPEHMRVVGIGASAGGLQALKALLPTLSEDTNACYVIVVHLSPEHESQLAKILQPCSKLPVCQVEKTTTLERNHIYVIPPGANIEAEDHRLSLSDLEPQRQHRAPIDRFFRTLAETHQERAVGIVLTGTGSDGTAGLRNIRERGGLTIVQSPHEAEYDAMPRSAIDAGVADLVVPVDQLAKQILEIETARPDLPQGDGQSKQAPDAENTLQKVRVF